MRRKSGRVRGVGEKKNKRKLKKIKKETKRNKN
jgi:hypothetical protein